MQKTDYTILLRAVLFGVFLTAVGLLGALTAGYFSARVLPTWGGTIAVILGLFVIWLVHGSTVRSVFRLERSTGFIWLVFGGIVTVLAGTALASAVRRLIENQSDVVFPVVSTAAYREKAIFMLGLAVFLSLFSVINIKVKSRFLGNLLELILIVVTLVFIMRFLQKG